MQAVGHHIPVVGQGDRRQGHAVGGVGVGAHRLADHVDHPVRVLSLGYQSVQGPSGDPHQVAPGLIVLRVLHCDPAAVEQRAHQALHEVVRGAVILPGEILLGDVVHNVVNAGHHLVLGQGIGILGVEDGELGKDLLPEDVADLLLGGVIGDYRAPVHLGTGAHHGQHTAHGNEAVGRLLHADIVFLPGVLVAPGGDGHALGIVAAGAAPHRQEKVHVVLPGDFAPFIEFFRCGIGHDPGVLKDFFACGLQDGYHLVVNPVFLDGAAPVDQLDPLAVVGQLTGQGIQSLRAEMEFRGVAVAEITEHCENLLRYKLLSPSAGRPRPWASRHRRRRG